MSAQKLSIFLALTGLLIFTPAAFAGGGVIEINQTAVDAGGITAGDSAGFPVTISEAGSYRLTGNLSPGSNTAIEVTASGVTIDLGGFSITGSGSGSGNGVESAISVERVIVKNGHVSQMGARGLWLFGPGSQALNVQAHDNGSLGIQMGEHSLVEGCSARGNGADGILVSGGGIVRASTADYNGADGVTAGDGCVIEGNTATSNDGDGISGMTGCLYKGNASRFNGVFGLRAIGASGYTQNVFTSNSSGDVTGGTQIGENVCNTGALC